MARSSVNQKSRFNDPLSGRNEELRRELRLRSPESLAARTGVRYMSANSKEGEFQLAMWDEPLVLTYPDLMIKESTVMLPVVAQSLLLYYFYNADGAPMEGRWVSFADLPGGRVYNQAYQSYTGDELVKALKDISSFRQAAESSGGIPFKFGDAAYVYQMLPRVGLIVVYWRGDDEFAASCKILFDASVSHYLPIDACAVAGSMLTKRILHGMGDGL
jgi:hypothetical protein